MPVHENFFETLDEARMRLRNTVVLYDGEPYYVVHIDNHKPGPFRIYMDKCGQDDGRLEQNRHNDFPLNQTNSPTGKNYDDWMTKHPSTTLVRKYMNSPLFNKFRPFPLGMLNINGQAYYTERSPVRRTEQGLISNMILTSSVSLDSGNKINPRNVVNMTSKELADCIKGVYPDAEEALKALRDPDYTDESVGISRDFALIRGPVDMVFVAYKSDVVGVLPMSDFTKVRLGKKYSFAKEVFTSLQLFNSVEVSQ